jgi:hypothetical protein
MLATKPRNDNFVSVKTYNSLTYYVQIHNVHASYDTRWGTFLVLNTLFNRVIINNIETRNRKCALFNAKLDLLTCWCLGVQDMALFLACWRLVLSESSLQWGFYLSPILSVVFSITCFLGLWHCPDFINLWLVEHQHPYNLLLHRFIASPWIKVGKQPCVRWQREGSLST